MGAPSRILKFINAVGLTDVFRWTLLDVMSHPHTTTTIDVNAENSIVVTDELCKENLQLAAEYFRSSQTIYILNSDENLRKEPRIVELSNQYRIICTTELAAAQEKLNELYRQKEEITKLNSPLYLLQRIQEAMNKTDEESENLHHQFLDREIDLGAFLQKYKKLRTAYHRKSLINLAAKTSNI
ncbi:hypothetical protein V8G54_028043 [Vigna mungo]|uniref:VPS37 C-terminal domain-containing protein n=1 Tax=Vigna mungo TaxID=3915 RepID=A0AAQ3RK79_VIGMU